MPSLSSHRPCDSRSPSPSLFLLASLRMRSEHAAALLLLCALSLLTAAAAQQFTQGSFGFYGSGNNQYDFSHCLDGSGSGSLFVTGSTDGPLLGQSSVNSGGYDWLVLKFDKNNGFLTRNANNPTLRFLTTSGTDHGHSCVSDTSGAVYVAGVTTGNLSASGTTLCGRDTVVAKYDNQLNLVWQVQIDASKACQDDWAMKVLLYGSQLYVVGVVYHPSNYYYFLPYLMALSTADGSQLWAAPVTYGYVTGIAVAVRDAAVDPNGNVILVGSYGYQGLPASHTLNGSVIPALPLVGSESGYVASFDNLGNLRWQVGNGGGSYSLMTTVTTDVTGAVYAGGFAEASVHGAVYAPTSNGNPLPLMQKMDSLGNVLWTVLYPQADGYLIKQVVTDNIGGVFWLSAYYQCYAYSGENYNVVAYLDSTYSCSSSYQALNMYKTDVNGAVQFSQAFSSGIAQSLTIDNTGLLTLSGDIGAGVTLHGAAATVAGYSGFIDQQVIAYNCSCNNLASLVAQMSTLLNISTS